MTRERTLSHVLYLLILTTCLFIVSCAGVSPHQVQELGREIEAPTTLQEAPLVNLESPEPPQKFDDLNLPLLDSPCYNILPIVPFDFDRSTLNSEAIEALTRVGILMRYCPTWVLEVEGHTDWEGDENYNFGLANRRARAVIYYLIYDQGVEAERLVSSEKLSQGILAGESYGEFVPIAPNNDESRRAYNRRVQFSKIVW